MADLDAPLFRINDPRQASAAGEEILQPRINLGASIVFREDFNRQIGSPRGKPLFVRLESKRLQPRDRNKGYIRRAAIAIEHPESGAGIQHGPKPVGSVESFDRKKQPGADPSVKPGVFGALDQLSIDYRMYETISGASNSASVQTFCGDLGLTLMGRIYPRVSRGPAIRADFASVGTGVFALFSSDDGNVILEPRPRNGRFRKIQSGLGKLK